MILYLAQVSTSSQGTVIACRQFKRTHANETMQVYAVLVRIAFLCLSCAFGGVPPSQRARGTARKSGVHMQTVTVGIVGGSDLVKIKEQLGENGTHLEPVIAPVSPTLDVR